MASETASGSKPEHQRTQQQSRATHHASVDEHKHRHAHRQSRMLCRMPAHTERYQYGREEHQSARAKSEAPNVRRHGRRSRRQLGGSGSSCRRSSRGAHKRGGRRHDGKRRDAWGRGVVGRRVRRRGTVTRWRGRHTHQWVIVGAWRRGGGCRLQRAPCERWRRLGEVEGCTEAGGASGGWQQRHGWDGGIKLHTPRWRGGTLPPATCQPPRLGASRSSDPADGWTGSGGGGGYTARGRHAAAASLACCCPSRDLDHPDPTRGTHEFPVCNITQESGPLSRIPHWP